MMKSFVVAAFTAAALSGCDAAPQTFWIAFDDQPARNLKETCYLKNEIPTNSEVTTSQFNKTQWVLWDGPDGARYLEMGAAKFTLGHSPTIIVDEALQGKDKNFSGTRTITNIVADQGEITKKTTVTVDFSMLDSKVKGSIKLQSQYICSGKSGFCDNPAQTSCEQTLQFNGARIPTDRESNYVPAGSGSTVAPASTATPN